MANLLTMELGKGKGKGKQKIRKNQIPVKRSINLVYEEKKEVRVSIALPAIILIIIAASVFSKYAVFDRFSRVAAAQAEVSALQARLDAGYAELKDFDDLSDLYAHYTFSGMTDEERTRTNRVDVMELIQTVVMPRVRVSSWSLSGNVINVNVTGTSLQQINLIVQSLEEDMLVDYCTVTTAVGKELIRDSRGNVIGEGNSTVTATLVVYLNPGTEVYQ